MASNSGTNKRRRTAADTIYISDLPIGFIVDVSDLAKPSRALLAVAFSAPSSSQSQNDDLMHRLLDISTAIVSASRWDVLDFEAIDKELANRLTDDDVWEILTSINAHDVLKRLKLCGCINIEGHGLNPLRGSVVLEQIDISLVRKHEKQKSDPQSKISDEVVLPILDSISSLKHITFPKQWRDGQFRQRYNQLYDSRELSCSHCNQRMTNERMMSWLSSNRMFQNNVCYDCLKSFCDDCTDNRGVQGRMSLNYCSTCEKDFCVDCVSRTDCAAPNCGNNMCSGCAETHQCQQCNGTKCKSCLYTCDECKRTRCNGCVSYHDEGKKSFCADCYNYNAKPSLLLGYRAPC